MKQKMIGLSIVATVVALGTIGGVLSGLGHSTTEPEPTSETYSTSVPTADYASMTAEQRDDAFLQRLDEAGVLYFSPVVTAQTGQWVCQMAETNVAYGQWSYTGLQHYTASIWDYTPEAANALILIAHGVYCPDAPLEPIN